MRKAAIKAGIDAGRLCVATCGCAKFSGTIVEVIRSVETRILDKPSGFFLRVAFGSGKFAFVPQRCLVTGRRQAV